MNSDAENRLLAFLGDISAIPGVRGALITTGDGALFSGDGVFNQSIAADLARTVRRMVVASATVGAPLAELLTQQKGSLPAKSLWQQSGLTIDAFYHQLKTEIAQGWIAPPAEAEMKVLEDA